MSQRRLGAGRGKEGKLHQEERLHPTTQARTGRPESLIDAGDHKQVNFRT